MQDIVPFNELNKLTFYSLIRKKGKIQTQIPIICLCNQQRGNPIKLLEMV